MAAELVEIQPPVLNFTFEVKKQSVCLIQLVNKSDRYVAFKVKTTSPKKYCVRPNIGVIKPRETCDFTVTMQAQGVAPPDFLCKDKFLIQSTVVPFGTVEEDLTSDVFVKDAHKYIEERKLKVVLLSPPQSPVLLPHNGELKPEFGHEASLQNEKMINGVENIPPPHRAFFQLGKPEDLGWGNADNLRVTKDVEGVKEANELGPAYKHLELGPAEGVEGKIDAEPLKFSYDFENLSKLKETYSKLREAEHTIMKLMEERGATTREKDTLKQELAMSMKMKGTRKIQVGFPFLCVCLVALISLGVGYFSHS